MWTVHRNDSVTLDVDDLAACLDLIPLPRFTSIRCGDVTSPVEILRVGFDALRAEEVGPTECEWYLRNRDLMAIYQLVPEHQLRLVMRWRALRPGAAHGGAGVDLAISLQTNLLDADPAMTVASTLPCEEGLGWSDDGHLVDLADRPDLPLRLVRPGAGPSYVEMVHPDDAVQLAARMGNSNVELNARFFDERLEKGVIRRVRLRAVWLPRDRDVDAARALYADFLQQPLPLSS